MNPKTDCLKSNHGLEPGEVQLYRLMRLCFSPETYMFENSVTGRELTKCSNHKAMQGLITKGYVRVVSNENSTRIIEVIK